MSFILNALRKSDQARQDKQAETPGQRYIEAYDESEKKSNFPWLIVLVTINLALLSYFIWSATQEDADDNTKEKTSIIEKKSIKNKIEIKPAAELTIEPSKASISQRIKEQKIQKNRVENSKRRVELKIKQEFYDDEETKAPSVIKITDEADVKAIPKQKTSNNNSSSPPFLSEMSSDFKRTVPSLNINVFVYSKNEGERFVMLDMKRYQQGQEIDEGLLLKEIRQNSIVVKFRNRTFQVRR